MPTELAFNLVSTEQDSLEQAESMVRSYCGWHIAPSKTVTVRMAGSYTRTQILPSLHVTAVESVTYDGQLLDPADYTWTEAGVLSHWGHWGMWGCRELAVTFTHGYPTVPPEVVATVQALAKSSPLSSTITQVGLVRYTGGGAGEWREVLDRYRLPKRP